MSNDPADGLPPGVPGEETEEETRALDDADRKRLKGAAAFVKKMRERGDVTQLSGSAGQAVAEAIAAELLADVDLPDAPPPENSGKKRPDKRLKKTARVEGLAVVGLHEKPSKKTVRAERPALAGTGDTESYARAAKAALQEQIAAARAAKSQAAGTSKPPVRRTSAKLVVRVDSDEDDEENTWISGAFQASAPPPRVQQCSISKRSTDGFAVRRIDGTIFMLPISRALAVGLGVVVDHPQPGRETLFLDIVTNWGAGDAGPVVLRFDTTNLPLHRLVGKTTGHIAAVKLLASEIAANPKCKRIPERADWPGPPFARYSNPASMDLAFYGGMAAT